MYLHASRIPGAKDGFSGIWRTALPDPAYVKGSSFRTLARWRIPTLYLKWPTFFWLVKELNGCSARGGMVKIFTFLSGLPFLGPGLARFYGTFSTIRDRRGGKGQILSEKLILKKK